MSSPEDYASRAVAECIAENGGKNVALYLARAIEQATFSLQEEVDQLNALFDLRHNADMRAIKRWQKATGRDLTWPDQTDLLVWLLEQLDEAHAALPPVTA